MTIDDTLYNQVLADDRQYLDYLAKLEEIYADMDELHAGSSLYIKKLTNVRRMKSMLESTLPSSDSARDGLLDTHKSVREATIRRIAGQSALSDTDTADLAVMIFECAWKFYEPLEHDEELI